jgi:hypothetical protein
MMRSWLPPEPPRAHPGWAVASVVAHAALLAVLLAISGSVVRDPSQSYIAYEPARRGPVVYIDLPYVPGGGGGTGPPTGTGAVRGAEPMPAPGADVAGEGVPLRIEPDKPPGPGIVPPTGGIGEGAGRRRLGPELGDGRVWVRPVDAIAAAIAGMHDDSADAKTHMARIDSAIAARIMAFLDTLGPDPMATPAPKPWVTDVGGQKWGIDQGWIYLGNLKLPSAILALIPLPQGNYELAQRDAELQRIRLDIMQSARRAESAEQFKKYVEETRKRRDAEREARKNQRTKPDSIKT